MLPGENRQFKLIQGVDSDAAFSDPRKRMRLPSNMQPSRRFGGPGGRHRSGMGPLLLVLVLAVSFSEAKANTGRETYLFGRSTRIIVPREFRWRQPERQFAEAHGARLDLYSRNFNVGDVVYAEIRLPAGASYSRLSLDGDDLPLTRTSYGLRTFFAIPSNFRARHMELKWVVPDLKIEKYLALRPVGVKFPIAATYRRVPAPRPKRQESGIRPPPQSSDLDRRLQEERSIKARIFSYRSYDRVQATLSHPRDRHHITSPIFVRRMQVFYHIEKGRRKETGRLTIIHNGVDLRGTTGAPIYALMDGQVVLSRGMYFEGNYTVIDHGNGVFSGYMHQSKFHVSPGQTVHAGDLIGEVGTTGYSTGPHLHISLTIRGIAADPLSLLMLPVRK